MTLNLAETSVAKSRLSVPYRANLSDVKVARSLPAVSNCVLFVVNNFLYSLCTADFELPAKKLKKSRHKHHKHKKRKSSEAKHEKSVGTSLAYVLVTMTGAGAP